MELLPKEQQKSYKKQKSVVFVKKNLKIKIYKIKGYHKFRDHCRYTGENRGAQHM